MIAAADTVAEQNESNHDMQTGMEPFAVLAKRATEKAVQRDRERRLGELVTLIDELSGEMGSIDFVTAVRAHGYNIEADTVAIERRQLGITTH